MPMLQASVIVPTAGAPATCAWRSSRSPPRTSGATPTRCWSSTTGPPRRRARVTQRGRRAHRRADRLRRARGRAGPELRPQHGHGGGGLGVHRVRGRRRRGAAGLAARAASRAAQRHPEAPRVRRADPAAAGGLAAADVRPRAAADHDPRRRPSRPRDRARLGREHGGRPGARFELAGMFDAGVPYGFDEDMWERRLRERRRPGRLHRRRRARPPPRLARLAAVAADACRLPRAAGRCAPTSSTSGDAPRPCRRAARAGRLRLAHLPLPLRQRPAADRPLRRAGGADARADERAGRSTPSASSRARAGSSQGGARGCAARIADALDDAVALRLAPPRSHRPARRASGRPGRRRARAGRLRARPRRGRWRARVAELRAHAGAVQVALGALGRGRARAGGETRARAACAAAASSRTSTRCSERAARGRRRVGDRRSTTTWSCRAASWTGSCSSPSASASSSPSPRCAHTSHAAWPRLRRARGSGGARARAMVEIGPLTAFRRSVAAGAAARSRRCGWDGASTPTGARSRRERGWRLGVVDATPIRHESASRRRLRPRRGGRGIAGLPAGQAPPRPREPQLQVLERHRASGDYGRAG